MCDFSIRFNRRASKHTVFPVTLQTPTVHLGGMGSSESDNYYHQISHV